MSATPKNHPHRWTEQDHETMRLYYDCSKVAIDKLARLIGVSRDAVKSRATILRLTKPQKKQPNWTADEINKLAELTPKFSPEKIAKKLKRSVLAIRVQQYRLQLKGREWFSLHDIVDVFGVADKTVRSWLESEKLHGKRYRTENGFWKITPADLRDFVIRCPTELQGRKVDMVFLVDLLANYQANGKNGVKNT